MTGVEILAIEEVVAEQVFNWQAFFIAFGISFVFLSLVGLAISSTTRGLGDLLIGMFLGVIFGCIFGTLFGSVMQIPTKYETQYKVTISDEVQMNEFLSRYEIVDQEGKIYTVRELDNGQ